MICDFPAIYAKICDEIYQCVSVSEGASMCACVRVCVCAQLQQFRFFILKCLSSPLCSFASYLPSHLLLYLLLYLLRFPYSHLSLSPSLSLSLSPSPHSLCVARVMSARNLPRKLAYKNVDGKYLRSSSSSSSSTAAAKATITATTVEYRQQHPTLFDSLYEFG